MKNSITKLCKLAYKYGTDKCPQLKHSYTPIYYKMFKNKRNSVKKVLEMGIGYYSKIETVPVVFDSKLKRYYHRGASLKMWRDFFPNAQIFGADVRPQTLFDDKRIKTYQCNERKKEDLERLIKNTGPDIDIFIDDASHHVQDQIFLAQTILPLLKKDVCYIIEDVSMHKKIEMALTNYNCHIPLEGDFKDGNMLLVVKNK